MTTATKIWLSPQERAYTAGWRACMASNGTLGRERLAQDKFAQSGYDAAYRLIRSRNIVEYYQRKEGK